MVHATLFVGFEGLAVRCSSVKERSCDRSAESTHLPQAAVFVPFWENIIAFVAWVLRTSKIRDKTRRKRAKCTEMQRVSNHAESSLSAWFTYVVQNRTTVLVPKLGPVQRVSR